MKDLIERFAAKRRRQHAMADRFLANRTRSNLFEMLRAYCPGCDFGMDPKGVTTFTHMACEFPYELLANDLDCEWWVEDGDLYIGGLRFIGVT